MKEQTCVLRAEGSCPPTSPIHILQNCLCFSRGYSFLRRNNERRVDKEKSKGFQKKASTHVETVTAT